MQVTEELSKKVRDVVSCGLVRGVGEPTPGKMCVEAAVCYAMGLPHGDNPSCVGYAVRKFKIRLNDSPWSSNEARGKGMLKLAIAQLGSDSIDQVEFSKKMALASIKILLADLLDRLKLKDHADACRQATDLKSAELAARNARIAAAAAADAAYAAYAAAARDYYLNLSAKICLDILIEMNQLGNSATSDTSPSGWRRKTNTALKVSVSVMEAATIAGAHTEEKLKNKQYDIENNHRKRNPRNHHDCGNVRRPELIGPCLLELREQADLLPGFHGIDLCCSYGV